MQQREIKKENYDRKQWEIDINGNRIYIDEHLG